jgi:hypothetical protein
VYLFRHKQLVYDLCCFLLDTAAAEILPHGLDELQNIPAESGIIRSVPLMIKYGFKHTARIVDCCMKSSKVCSRVFRHDQFKLTAYRLFPIKKTEVD